MKVGIIGVGAVGTACANALLLRGSCHEIVLLDKDARRAQGCCNDLSHGAVLCPATRLRVGDYASLEAASVVIVTAGLKEADVAEAVERTDTQGRLRLLRPNADIYQQIIPQIARSTPKAIILIVTDPPDPLADVARQLTATNPVLSAGTYLDTLRFRLQIASRLDCHPASVDALVLGEHGTSQVYIWSTAQVGGELVLRRLEREKRDIKRFRADVEQAVKFANIDIIEGTGASQRGIGIVTARIVEAMLRHEGLVAPIGVPLRQHDIPAELLLQEYDVTLSLPAVIDRVGVSRVLNPQLSSEEAQALAASAEAIKAALARL